MEYRFVFLPRKYICITKQLPKLKVCDSDGSQFLIRKISRHRKALELYVFCMWFGVKCIHSWFSFIFQLQNWFTKNVIATCNHFALVIRQGLHATVSRNCADVNNTNRIKFIWNSQHTLSSLLLSYSTYSLENEENENYSTFSLF